MAAVRRLIPLALLFAAACGACSGGDGDGRGDDPFDQLVDLVPASAITDEAMLQYVDMDLVWERLGVGDDSTERLDNIGRTGLDETYAIPPTLFQERAVMVEEARAEVGFDVTDISQEIAVDLPPSELRIVRVAVAPDDVIGALESDPLWSDRREEVDADGGTYFDWTDEEDELAIDPARRSPMRPLGTGGQLAVTDDGDGDGSLVVRTKQSALMESTLATAGGDEPSVGEDSVLAPALDELGQGGGSVVQAVGQVGALRIDPELLGDGPAIEPYEGFLLVELVDGDAYRTEVFVVHDDDAAATANADVIFRRLTEETSAATGQPFDELLPVEAVEHDGVVVRIVFDEGVSFRVAFAAVNRDLLAIAG